MATPVMEVINLTKTYPGVVALEGVSLHVKPHEVLGLVGENGAGKSTLLKVLIGLEQPDQGTISVRGKQVCLRSPKAAGQLGIGMVFQEQSLLLNVSVAENIFLGNEEPFLRGGLIHWKAMKAAASVQLQKVHSDLSPSALTGEVTFIQRQMVELAKVLTLQERTHHEPIILLDEPTSVLTTEEIKVLFNRIQELRGQASIVFISHRLDEVLEVADRIYVMKDGKVVAERVPAQTDMNELYQLMVGKDLNTEYYKESKQTGFKPEDALLGVRGLGGRGFRQVDFDLHRGEVLGLVGVLGSGREEVVRALFGAEPYRNGEVRLDGRPVRISSPAVAVKHGISYVPMERRVEGLVLYMNVAANITMPNLRQVLRGGIIRQDIENKVARDWIRRLGIKAPGTHSLCLNLSGGNQQKVVLAKWLSAGTRVLILDHPSRGLDVGAKEDVYALIRTITAQGIGVIMTCDTLEEAIGLSDTLLVMKDGVVSRRLSAPPGAKPAQVDVIPHMV